MTEQYVEYLNRDYDNIINDRIAHGWTVAGIIPESVAGAGNIGRFEHGGFIVLYERPDRIPVPDDTPVTIRPNFGTDVETKKGVRK